jgi:NHL repeat
VSAKLARPFDVALAPNGALIIADTLNQVIRRVDASGRIATIAGSGTRGDAVRRTSAPSARFREPSGVAVDEDGSILVADAGNNAIRRIGVDGTVSTLADEGLSNPTDIAVLGKGRYAVADTGHSRVVSLSSSGDISPLAGTGRSGLSGDGGPAVSARLNGPTQLSVSTTGLLIADTRNRVIREVRDDGTIATIAGHGDAAAPGQTPATRIELAQPTGVAATADGGFVVSDVGRIWAASAGGEVQSIAGTDEPGFNGDTGRAVATRLDHPAQLAADAMGGVLVADTDNDRVRRIAPTGLAITLAGSDKPGVALAPVVSAPFQGRPPSRRPAPERYGARRHRRGRTLAVPFRAGLVEGSARRPCAKPTTTYNYLKIRPYTSTLIRSAARPVRIRFGTSVDARITSYAWRSGQRHGRRTRRVVAGPRTIRLKGALRPGRYVAVIEGKDRHGLRRCDSRRLRIVR